MILETLRKVYFESGHVQVLKNVTGFRKDAWLHVDMEDGSQAIINPEKVEMIRFWGTDYQTLEKDVRG